MCKAVSIVFWNNFISFKAIFGNCGDCWYCYWSQTKFKDKQDLYWIESASYLIDISMHVLENVKRSSYFMFIFDELLFILYDVKDDDISISVCIGWHSLGLYLSKITKTSIMQDSPLGRYFTTFGRLSWFLCYGQHDWRWKTST